MTSVPWNELVFPPDADDQMWSVFHENSKTSRYWHFPSNEHVVARMTALKEALSYDDLPSIELPPPSALDGASLMQAVVARESARKLATTTISLESLATILHAAYGITRDLRGEGFPRRFRTVPSGGGLFPLEIYLWAGQVEGLAPGLYHFDPARHVVALLREGELAPNLAGAFVQPDLAEGASLVLFLTAVFERTVFKYGDRGYRFIFLEAGHVAQNANLVATALGLGVTNVGGFMDRKVDEILDLDGVTHSAIYLVAIGGRTSARAPPAL